MTPNDPCPHCKSDYVSCGTVSADGVVWLCYRCCYKTFRHRYCQPAPSAVQHLEVEIEHQPLREDGTSRGLPWFYVVRENGVWTVEGFAKTEGYAAASVGEEMQRLLA